MRLQPLALRIDAASFVTMAVCLGLVVAHVACGTRATSTGPASSPGPQERSQSEPIVDAGGGPASSLGAEVPAPAGSGSQLSASVAGPPPPKPVQPSLARADGAPGDALLAEGDAAYENDDFEKADAKYRQAARLAPSDPAPKVGICRVAIAKTNLATDYNVAPKHPVLERVVADLRRTINKQVRFGPAYTEMGRALLMLGRAEEAQQALAKAIDIAPDEAEAHSAYGVAMLATGNIDSAVQHLERSAALDPGSAPRQTNLGTALMMQGRTADALRAYEVAARLSPDDPRILGDIGTALLADNQVDAAVSSLNRAVAVDPKRATLRSNLCYALELRHDFRAAIAECRQAVALDEKLVSGWVNLATAFALTGDRAEAKKALERARKIDPSDPRVKANLEELRALEQKRASGPGTTGQTK